MQYLNCNSSKLVTRSKCICYALCVTTLYIFIIYIIYILMIEIINTEIYNLCISYVSNMKLIYNLKDIISKFSSYMK